jgi:GAF domain-containing protein
MLAYAFGQRRWKSLDKAVFGAINQSLLVPDSDAEADSQAQLAVGPQRVARLLQQLAGWSASRMVMDQRRHARLQHEQAVIQGLPVRARLGVPLLFETPGL